MQRADRISAGGIARGEQTRGAHLRIEGDRGKIERMISQPFQPSAGSCSRRRREYMSCMRTRHRHQQQTQRAKAAYTAARTAGRQRHTDSMAKRGEWRISLRGRGSMAVKARAEPQPPNMKIVHMVCCAISSDCYTCRESLCALYTSWHENEMPGSDGTLSSCPSDDPCMAAAGRQR